MRSSILYIVPDLIGLPGGIARYCRHVCRALSDMGERVNVIALRDAKGSDPRTEGLDIDHYTPCARNKVEFALRAFVGAARSRPRLILCGHPNFAPLAYSVSRAFRVPYVVFLYGTDSWEPLPGSRGFALRRADHFVSISRHTARLAEQANGLAMNRIEILHNCLDPEFRFSDSECMRQRRASMLTVSRITTFEPHKGQETVLRALPRLVEKFPDLVYDIVGDGDRRQSLEKMATDLGVRDSVRFHGVVTDEMLAEFYSTGAVFVMPSTVEGFGFVFAEAMAHGMPAIGGNTDAGPEVIVDGRTGYVIDPTSSDAVVETVSSLLGSAQLWNEMSEAALAHARTNFSYSRFRDRLGEILVRVTGSTDERQS